MSLFKNIVIIALIIVIGYAAIVIIGVTDQSGYGGESAIQLNKDLRWRIAMIDADWSIMNGASIEIVYEVYNPNNFPATIESARISIFYGSGLLGDVNINQEYVEERDTRLIPTRLNIGYSDALSLGLNTILDGSNLESMFLHEGTSTFRTTIGTTSQTISIR